MATLEGLRDKLRGRKRSRDRQSRLFKRTGKRGHARAARRHAKAVRYLRKLIRRKATMEVIPRSVWGAAPPRGGYVRQPAQIVAGIQHHDAYPQLPASASIAEECAHMRRIQQGHFARGFTDIGYALVVFASGRIYEGRPAWAVGAQTEGHNTGYRGWVANGNFEIDQPTTAQIAGCHRARVLLGCSDRPLFGHYELTPTACPGKNLKPHLRKEI